jgi:haloacetate dehalogenase
MDLFEGFDTRRVSTGDASIFVRTGGRGPPLLLLHGFPQTHHAWHAVARRLGERFSLVIPDVRGYGQSGGPPPDPEHLSYSKRAMAGDMVAVMASLGHERFMLAGHDRGGRIGYRLALDHPERVLRFAPVDIVPTLDVWEAISRASALGSYHWSFLAQPAPVPERLIGHDPSYYVTHLLERWAGRPGALDARAVSEYLAAFARSSVIAAACEDYRAGAGVDVAHDRADREAGRRIRCPTMLLWGKRYLSAKTREPLEIWRTWADDVREVALDCGHFVAEEQPEECATALEDFFAG